MTPTEFEYIQRAMKALEEPLELVQRIKIERTMGQILTRSADKMEEEFCKLVDTNMERNRLVDILKS